MTSRVSGNLGDAVAQFHQHQGDVGAAAALVSALGGISPEPVGQSRQCDEHDTDAIPECGAHVNAHIDTDAIPECGAHVNTHIVAHAQCMRGWHG